MYRTEVSTVVSVHAQSKRLTIHYRHDMTPNQPETNQLCQLSETQCRTIETIVMCNSIIHCTLYTEPDGAFNKVHFE